MPLEDIKGEEGRAKALKIHDCTMAGMTPIPTEGTERVLEADLIVAAIGQGGDMTGLEEMANDRNLFDADKFYQMPSRPGHFVAGDIVRPHLLTTAIGQASIAVDSIHDYLDNGKIDLARRPKVDVHHFDLEDKLVEAGLSPSHFDIGERGDLRGTSSGNWAIHNYEDRSFAEIIPHDELFLGHFAYHERNKRREEVPSADEVLGHFMERLICLDEAQAQDEAGAPCRCDIVATTHGSVEVLADGSVLVYAGTSDMGQGARTIFVQIACEVLGVEAGRIALVTGDTARTPDSGSTVASAWGSSVGLQ